jgi:hypothetical protein
MDVAKIARTLNEKYQKFGQQMATEYRPPWLPPIVSNLPEPYNPNSCNTLVKIFYTPIEAAIRWCGLIEHEAHILRGTGDDLFPNAAKFSHWPCLRANTEKIIDACRNGSLIFGNQGVTIKQTESWRITMVAPPYLTIMHTDLRTCLHNLNRI